MSFLKSALGLAPAKSTPIPDGDYMLVNPREDKVRNSEIEKHGPRGNIRAIDLEMCEKVIKNKFNLTDLKWIANGGFGRVYTSKDRLGKQYVLKTVRPRFESAEYEKEVYMKETNRELYILTNLAHENFVKLYSYTFLYDEHGLGHVVMAMELLCDIVPLIDLPFPPAVIKKFVKEIGGALAFLHSKNIAHHDIKIENVMHTSQMSKLYDSRQIINKKLMKGSFKLIDFGLVRRHPTRKESYFRGGTLYFTCPEKFYKVYDVYLSDAFSFGVIILLLWFGTDHLKPYMDKYPRKELVDGKNPFTIICAEVMATLDKTPKELCCIRRLLAEEKERCSIEQAIVCFK